ncbi:MAG: GGDEF domain-containing protein [Litorimonas sp.]
MISHRISTLLQNNSGQLHEQSGISDAQLVEHNQTLTNEVSRLRLRILQLEQAADTDPLVPVYNRRAFIREIARAQTVMARYDLLSTVLFFDLNGFKAINDRFGHSIGDSLLQKIGNVLLSGVRDCDMVARLGGDEFAILLFKTDTILAKAKAAALSCRIADQYIDMPTGKVKVTSAWGVAPCDPNDTPIQVLDRADRAMYIAKRKS